MTAPVSTRETGPRFAVKSAVDVCSFVDQVDRKAVGELVIRTRGPAPEIKGVVFVEAGRVCWAAARGLARRLTELLIAHSGVEAEEMEEIFRHCRTAGVPLGESLVERGIVRPEALRRALLEHTTESLAALCDGEAEGGFCLRAGRGYSPRFTFATAEIVAKARQRELEPADSRVLPEVTDVLSSSFLAGEWGAAFVRGSGAAPTPVVVHGELPDTTSDVVRVGKWAASALDLASTFQDEDAFVSALDSPRLGLAPEMNRRHHVFVAWRDVGGTVIAGRMTAQGPARILNRRAQVRRTSG